MRRKVKKFTALVLALLMVAALAPMTAWAADASTIEKVQELLDKGDGVTLKAEVEGDVVAPSNYVGILNLYVNIIKGTVTNKGRINIQDDKTGGGIHAKDTEPAIYTLSTDTAAVTTINGGTFKGDIVASAESGEAEVRINKGTFDGDIVADTKTSGGAGKVQITINGGTFDGKPIVLKNSDDDDANITISGGTFIVDAGSIDAAKKVPVSFEMHDASPDTITLGYAFTTAELKLGDALPEDERNLGDIFEGWDFKNAAGQDVPGGPHQTVTEELLVELQKGYPGQAITAAPVFTRGIGVVTPANGTLKVDKPTPSDGDKVTVTALPAAGYILKELIVKKDGQKLADGDVKDGGNGKYTFTYPADGHISVEAVFARGVIVASTVNGKISVSNPVPIPGEEVIITVTPGVGYELGQLNVMQGTKPCPVIDNGNGTHTFNFPKDSSVTITATFVQKNIVITKTGEGTVTVTPAEPKPGDTVTITVKPDEKYILGQLTVKNGTTDIKPEDKGNGVYTFTYPATGTVTVDVLFSIGIVISETKNGTVKVDKPAPKAGETVTVTTTSDAGYILKKLTVENGTTELTDVKDHADGTHTFTYPTGSDVVVTIKAEFTPGVTVAETENGTVKINKNNPAKDETVIISVTPDKTYRLDKLTVKNGAAVITPKDNGNGTFSFVYPDGGTIHIEAAFIASIPFTDVPTNQWYYDAVVFAYDNSLFDGTSETAFSPNKNMNRAMMVRVLFNMTEGAQKGENKFTDVPSGQWYTDAVSWAATNGVVTGVGDNRFAPLSDISREQMAVMLYNYAKYMKIDLPKTRSAGAFADGGYISSWAKDAVNAMYAAEIINGKGDNKFDPQGKATRAQVAEMFMNFVNVTGK